MRNYIYNTATDSILAVADSQDRAHALAECISYMENSNSMYGLFKISLVSKQQLMATEFGRLALHEFGREA